MKHKYLFYLKSISAVSALCIVLESKIAYAAIPDSLWVRTGNSPNYSIYNKYYSGTGGVSIGATTAPPQRGLIVIGPINASGGITLPSSLFNMMLKANSSGTVIAATNGTDYAPGFSSQGNKYVLYKSSGTAWANSPIYTNGTTYTMMGIGAGTASPETNLEVYDTNRLTARTIRWIGELHAPNVSPLDTGGGVGLKLKHSTNADNPTKWGGIAAVDESGWYSNNIGLAFYTSQMNPTEKMRITSTGAVGIGLGSLVLPVEKLEVNGKIKVYDNINLCGHYLSADGTNNGIYISPANNGVGIGTSNVGTYMLAVNGTIKTREVVVTASPWPDYIFQKDHSLKPLDEVEKFVKKNNHLEGIPTEKEVKSKGVSVGDMQARLLQKIEELYMYAIEQNKKMDAQSAAIQEQNKKIATLEHANKELSKRLGEGK